MPVLPILLVVGAAVAIGLYLGWLFVRRERSKPMLVGAHLILGVLGIEGVAIMLTRAPDGSSFGAGSLGRAAAFLLILAVATGFLASILSPRRPRKVGYVTIGTHAAVALAGFLLLAGWIVRS